MSDEPAAPLHLQLTVKLPSGTADALDALAVKLSTEDKRPVSRAEAHRRALLAGIEILAAKAA